jgi:aryl-alcohol dehydrogenase-like predicted oxidoreductase
MTSLDVNEADSLATIHAALDAGINFLDTAYAYGPVGESERLIARAIAGRRGDVVIATKCGIEWDARGQRVIDGRPATLRRQCEESLRRLATDCVELLYLHAPDPNTPLAESAGELRRLMEEGKARSIGVSNVSAAQLAEFHAVCPVSAVQPPYNILQREIERDVVPWCRERGIAICVYWPLLKGLLAGKLPRDHVFLPGDGRAKYPMFQGDEWRRNQDFLDDLRAIAADVGKTVAQVVVNWTIHQPGITASLCGAKRPDQIRETAGALGWRLSAQQLARIDAALARRGTPLVRSAV